MKNIFIKLTEYPLYKILVAQIFLFLSWIFNGKTEIVMAVYTLIVIDTITGVWIAAKSSNITSRGFFRAPVKCAVYFAMLAVSRLVDRTMPIPLAAPVMDAFLVTTESVSILENFSKLGYPVPMFLVTKLKTFYENKPAQKEKL